MTTTGYDRVPGLNKYWVWSSTGYDRVLGMTEYWVLSSTVFKQVLGMIEYWVWPSTGYDRVPGMNKYWVCLSTRYGWVLGMTEYWVLPTTGYDVHCVEPTQCTCVAFNFNASVELNAMHVQGMNLIVCYGYMSPFYHLYIQLLTIITSKWSNHSSEFPLISKYNRILMSHLYICHTSKIKYLTPCHTSTYTSLPLFIPHLPLPSPPLTPSLISSENLCWKRHR